MCAQTRHQFILSSERDLGNGEPKPMLAQREKFPSGDAQNPRHCRPPRWPSGKASASRAEDPGFESSLRRDFFSGSSHTSDSKIDTLVATLPGAWRYRVSAGTGRPGVSIL